jgi:hypothetical protein
VSALANPEVGKYLNEYFVSSFQKVGTFKIVNGAKQGGNVASYFCAPDGRVLHAIAGPVNAQTMLHEARWVVETTKKALKEAKGDGGKFKAFFRKAHAEKLRKEHGVVVEALTYDPPDPAEGESALSYRDPTGRPLAPKLQAPPVEGPDITFRAAQLAETKAAGARALLDRRGRRLVLGNQGRVDMILAAHCMIKIEKLYATIFEGILGEKISIKPVEIVNPFPWVARNARAPVPPKGALSR